MPNSLSKSFYSAFSKPSSRAHPPMFAVGSDDNVTYTGKVQIFEYNENTRYAQPTISDNPSSSFF